MNEIEILEAHGAVDKPAPAVIRQAREQLMTTILESQHNNAGASEPTAPNRSSVPHRRRARFAIAAAVIAGGGLTATALWPAGVPAAAAELNRLAQIAHHHQVAGRGAVAHTKSTARWTDFSQAADGSTKSVAEDTERESWIAPDGSGRIIETRGTDHSDGWFKAGGLSYTSFADWPTTVNGVLERLRAEAKGTDMRPVDYEAFVLAGDALRETAAPADVRAAVFGAIAQLKGVRSLGAVKDPMGRPGVGFEIDSDAAEDHRSKLIFDPSTSELLAEQRGTVSKGYDDSNWAVYTVSELVAAVPSGGTLTK